MLLLTQNSFQRRMQITFLTKDEQLIEEVHSFLREWNNESPFVETKTSGSTGEAKTIRIEKKYMLASAKMTGDFLKLKEGQNALLCLSTKTIGGKMMLVRSIVLNLNLYVSDVCSTPLELVNDTIHFAAMVPLQVSASIKKTPKQLKSIHQLIIGGAPISRELEIQLHDFSNNVYQTFGMTETISHIALRKLSSGEQFYSALSDISFSTEDDCLIIHAPNLGIEKLISNDIVELISPTQFLWKGRSDFIINSGGIKHSPEELETALSPILNNVFFLTGIPDTQLGQKIVLIIESVEEEIDKKQLSSVLNNYQLPKEVYFIPIFARTDSGKINRTETLKNISNAPKQVL